jgi:hypothetical protein
MDWRRSGTSSALTQFIQYAQQLLPALGRTTGVAAAGCLAREPFRFRSFPLLSQTNLALAVSSGRVVGKRFLSNVLASHLFPKNFSSFATSDPTDLVGAYCSSQRVCQHVSRSKDAGL